MLRLLPTNQKVTAVPPKGIRVQTEATTGLAVNASQPTQNVNPTMKNETVSIKINGTPSSPNMKMTVAPPSSATANKTMK